MPAGAVLAAAVEVEPEIVVADSIVLRQHVAGGDQDWVGCLRELAVLRRRPRLEEWLTEDAGVRWPGTASASRWNSSLAPASQPGNTSTHDRASSGVRWPVRKAASTVTSPRPENRSGCHETSMTY